jgi:D-3-phosphoglycerate dehydrogenase
VTYGSLDTVVERSDILTLHLGYTPATHHLIDASRIRRMKPGALLVNAARGGLVDEEALAEGLRSQQLAGAFLDSFEREPYDGPLIGFDNVLLTPHIGSYAVEGRVRMEMEAADNLIRELAETR